MPSVPSLLSVPSLPSLPSGEPYRNCRAIFTSKEYTVVGIATDSSRLAFAEEVEG